ncbi:hypothetical protein QBC34DRAFT_154409 [Podospora aff. communis PSN243]|uniref:Uncharacterized protein n=1 Tax=Podospora aff. communis PSN243 TaxID=3040156 RepID=A0AAV9GF05_9PEZI|nr:hypothetical protein QBC34DRAFT_154409 [Podospora aff. communis PSN243]
MQRLALFPERVHPTVPARRLRSVALGHFHDHSVRRIVQQVERFPSNARWCIFRGGSGTQARMVLTAPSRRQIEQVGLPSTEGRLPVSSSHRPPRLSITPAAARRCQGNHGLEMNSLRFVRSLTTAILGSRKASGQGTISQSASPGCKGPALSGWPARPHGVACRQPPSGNRLLHQTDNPLLGRCGRAENGESVENGACAPLSGSDASPSSRGRRGIGGHLDG